MGAVPSMEGAPRVYKKAKFYHGNRKVTKKEKVGETDVSSLTYPIGTSGSSRGPRQDAYPNVNT